MADEMAEVAGAYRGDAEVVLCETGGMAAARHGNVTHSPRYRTAPHGTHVLLLMYITRW